MSDDERGGASRRRLALGWLAAAAALAWAGLVHHGFGPYPTQAEVPWWQPRGFLFGTPLLGIFGDRPRLAIAVLTLPGVASAVATFALTRSSLARLLALAGALASALFLFYGLRSPGPQIWSFFGWRGSAVMALMALVMAGALLAPVLAASWLRLRWPLRLALYLPILAAIVVAERNATGTNPALAFNISPWPVLTVFGFDGLCTLLAGALACLALALAAWRWGGRRPLVAGAGILVAALLPVAWMRLGLGGGVVLPLVTLVVAGVALAVAAASAERPARGLRSAGGHAAIGAALLALPLAAGQSWVRLDYTATREARAQQIIEALARFYGREGVYPERLAELVESGDLQEIPEPRIGFSTFGRQGFLYQNFGTDYLLEFAAPGWTQCAYNPPWEDEAEEDVETDAEVAVDEGEVDLAAELPLDEEAAAAPPRDDVAAGEADAAEDGAQPDAPLDADATAESLPGAWSCPSKPPELW